MKLSATLATIALLLTQSSFAYSLKSFENTENKALSSIHPELKDRALELKKIGKSIGLDVYVISGLRTVEEQKRLYLQGRETSGEIVTHQQCDIKNLGKGSKHCWGAAFDVYIFKNNKPANIADYKKLALNSKDLGLESGCFWTGFVDCPHYQMTDLLTYFSYNKKKSKIEYMSYSKPLIEKVNLARVGQLSKFEKDNLSSSIILDLIMSKEDSIDEISNENLTNPLSIIEKIANNNYCYYEKFNKCSI